MNTLEVVGLATDYYKNMVSYRQRHMLLPVLIITLTLKLGGTINE